MREIIMDMHENKFFKEYIVKYQKGLAKALQSCPGGSIDETYDAPQSK